jgi:hypothetical protein
LFGGFVLKDITFFVIEKEEYNCQDEILFRLLGVVALKSW